MILALVPWAVQIFLGEPKKVSHKKYSLGSIESWLFNRDPYFMVCFFNLHLTVYSIIPYIPKKARKVPFFRQLDWLVLGVSTATAVFQVYIYTLPEILKLTKHLKGQCWKMSFLKWEGLCSGAMLGLGRVFVYMFINIYIYISKDIVYHIHI